MRKLFKRILTFGKSENGPTAVEYAVLLTLIAIVIMAGARRMGNRSRRTFNQTARQLR
jgi:pilus assembly protein Flp/PilA